MPTGNQKITDLPLVTVPTSGDVYIVQSGDKRVRTGEANGLATLDGSGKVPAAQLPASSSTTPWSNVTSTPTTISGYGISDNTWANLLSKPSTFTPSAHTHLISEVINLQTTLDGKQALLGYTPIQQGTGVGQLNNTVKIGWDNTQLRVSVDSSDLGTFVLTSGFTWANLGSKPAGTGTGNLVYQTNPVLVTPNIGAATGTSLALGGGATLSKVTCSSAAPGALAAGELYLKY